MSLTSKLEGGNDVLLSKTADDFRTRTVIARIDGNNLVLDYGKQDISFPEMTDLRTRCPIHTIAENMFGEGHAFANLGVSARITTKVYDEGRDVLLLVKQERKDFDDGAAFVAKHISGYVSTDELMYPHRAALLEVAEELLVVDQEGRLVGGKFEEAILPRPYVDAPGIAYNTADTYTLIPERSAIARDLGMRRLNVVHGSHPEILPCEYYVDARHNCLQLVYDFRLSWPEPKETWLGHAEASLAHAEDTFEDGQLRVRYVPQGIFIIPIDGGTVKDRAYAFDNGKPVTWDQPLHLSEAFIVQSEFGVRSAVQDSVDLVNVR